MSTFNMMDIVYYSQLSYGDRFVFRYQNQHGSKRSRYTKIDERTYHVDPCPVFPEGNVVTKTNAIEDRVYFIRHDPDFKVVSATPPVAAGTTPDKSEQPKTISIWRDPF